jgi:biotin transport system permease protein
MLIGLYRSGDSLLHRCPAWVKLAGLAVFTTVLLMGRSPVVVAVAAVFVYVGYLVAGWGVRVLASQLWPLRWILLALIPFQWWTGGWWQVAVSVGTLLVAIAAAALVTVTTRVSDLLAVFVTVLRPLRAVGVDPERAGLALTVRAVPVLATLAREAAQARSARGLERSPRALLVPFVVRSVRHAQRTGDALVARGLDD